jgi:hypothetical protein
MKYRLIILTLLTAASASRGITVDYKASETSNAAVEGAIQSNTNSYALDIGIDEYSNGWPRLCNGIDDAREVAETLQSKEFEVTLKTNLNANDLAFAFRYFFIEKGANPQPRLFVWCAG